MKTLQKILLGLLISFLPLVIMNCSKDKENASNTINISVIDPESPASLQFEEWVLITYDYNIVNTDGARMWVIPQTDGDDSPGYLYSSSKIYSGQGTRQVGVSIADGGEGAVTVEQLQVIMKTPDQEEILFEQFINVDFTFSE